MNGWLGGAVLFLLLPVTNWAGCAQVGAYTVHAFTWYWRCRCSRRSRCSRAIEGGQSEIKT